MNIKYTITRTFKEHENTNVAFFITNRKQKFGCTAVPIHATNSGFNHLTHRLLNQTKGFNQIIEISLNESGISIF